MTNELEKQFFDTFGIGKPKLKVWRYSGYYEDYSWDSELIDCAELLERNNLTIEELDERIQTSKQEEKEKNSELYDYRFDSVETEFGKTTKAFVDYPQITDSILLELIGILSEWRQYCDSDYIIKAINIDTLKENTLKDCLYMSNWYEFKKCGKDIKHQVRTLFEEG